MPAKWTAERNERFFLLVIKDVKLNYEALAKEWKERYGDVDDFEPTARALNEQYKTLCKRAGVKKSDGGSNAGGTPKSTPKGTPAKPKFSAPKTPSSSAKKRNKAMSDQDDSEDERMMNGNGVSPSKRARYERGSKTPAKAYQDAGSDAGDGADDEADNKANILSQIKANGGVGSIFDQDLNLDGVSEKTHALGLGRRGVKNIVEMDGMTDISDFEPEYNDFQ